MPRNATLACNFKAAAQGAAETEGLTFLIRTDAQYATGGFRQQLLRAITDNKLAPVFKPQAESSLISLEATIKKSVHAAYQQWGESVLKSISDHVNYDLYEIDQGVRRLNVQYHNARALGEKIVDNAEKFIKARPGYNDDVPTIYVSLDEMFQQCRAPWGEIAFSRLFSLKGDQQFGYTARPGKMQIDEQVKKLAADIKSLRNQYSEKLPIVLLEDNVRHAKMLNWVIDLMDQHDVFADADLACISTCFCSASPDERAAIVYKGQSIPLVAAIDINSKSFEVSTPRDLFFDGYVVEVDGETTRLPGLFMDVEKLFKVRPDHVAPFTAEVKKASLDFCDRIEQEWGVQVPLKWFTCAKAISAVTGQSLDTPMKDILQSWGATPATPQPTTTQPATTQPATEPRKISLVQ